MTIKLTDKSAFADKFLKPIGKVNDNAILRVQDKNKLTSLVSSPDGSLILHATYNIESDLDSDVLNVPDINRFAKVIGCISDDLIELIIKNNCITYKSSDVKFKYHMIEDGILSSPPIDVNKIKQLEFDLTFKLDQSIISNLLKGSTFTTETSKIYFTIENGFLFGKLTDLQKANVDEFAKQLTPTYTGTIRKPLALDFEVIRMMASLKFCDVTVHINEANNVYLFNVKGDHYRMVYIASGFIG